MSKSFGGEICEGHEEKGEGEGGGWWVIGGVGGVRIESW